MLNNNFLKLGTISALLSSTLLGAGVQKCIGGVCFANLDNLKPSKGFQKERENILVLEKPRYVEVTSSNAQDNFIDKSMTIVLDGETITVFPKSSYMANENEVIYQDEEIPYDNDLLVIHSDEKVEDVILDKTGLPSSEFFCEKNTKALYDKRNDTFQCV